ncbi:MAG: hypothetical protein DDT42_01114 [candidate division WS2 bacterium]|uniref:Mannosyl-glycoprotein endo-beta-N-acetylglucosamidase-like domain-containing protein n=1 Tax=Psychracetigena formicireducens TaxID=2986056 RepID=A0A9E2F1A2_PSYF1|nr:hypothetical protein [Candidatus Psychracetigena formicireducens]
MRPSTEQWKIINKWAQHYNVDPNLIAAIGQHETGWGREGAGRWGFYTGYGVYDKGDPDPRWQGLENQVRMTAERLSTWDMREGNITRERLRQGNRGQLGRGLIYATDPLWADKVFRIFQGIRVNLEVQMQRINAGVAVEGMPLTPKQGVTASRFEQAPEFNILNPIPWLSFWGMEILTRGLIIILGSLAFFLAIFMLLNVNIEIPTVPKIEEKEEKTEEKTE